MKSFPNPTQPNSKVDIKKTLISIPAIAAPSILETLHKKNIEVVYVGLDESAKLIMQITHTQEQEAIISELQDYMNECNSFILELIEEIKAAVEEKKRINAMFNEFDKLKQEHDRKDRLRKDQKEQLKQEA